MPDQALRPIAPLCPSSQPELEGAWAPARQKLRSLEIEEFTGKFHEWPDWKASTEAALAIARHDEISTSKEAARASRKANLLVCAQLQRAVCKGAAKSLVERHEGTKDGHAAWKELNKKFDNATNKEKRVSKSRSDLKDVKLLPGRNVAVFIDKHENALRDVRKVEGEGCTDTQAKQTFLENIENPAHNATKEILNQTKATMAFEEATEPVQQKHNELKREAARRKRLKQQVCRIAKRQRHNDDSDPEDMEALGNKACRFQDKKPAALPKTFFLNEKGKIWLKQSHCQALKEEHEKFIKDCNGRMSKNKSLDGLAIPQGATIKKQE